MNGENQERALMQLIRNLCDMSIKNSYSYIHTYSLFFPVRVINSTLPQKKWGTTDFAKTQTCWSFSFHISIPKLRGSLSKVLVPACFEFHKLNFIRTLFISIAFFTDTVVQTLWQHDDVFFLFFFVLHLCGTVHVSLCCRKFSPHVQQLRLPVLILAALTNSPNALEFSVNVAGCCVPLCCRWRIKSVTSPPRTRPHPESKK